ncbi:hypothetical protein PLESTB_000525700 [Pleodorina starrii]|uniref:Uncharacterized protein n=1 Tax=Pleodorina starrii TaxID=330485 RepID=A0A9W6BH16_9CHLO|nr:hypothetical protein PLESTM_000389100 [Pleodorina starrii]GLC51655.1 hypothetical protein PLESTB_000525700 [Pleodorina starrii]GLC72423.1 hypothetical protein PLESTF_001246000 [Pleodorina starrii]
MGSIRPSPVKAISASQEASQLRCQVASLSHELEVTTQRCPYLGRLVSGPEAAVTAEDLLLTDEEVQEAALRALWLGHYWGLASNLGILPEVSKAQAERWQSVSPSVDVLHAAASDVARRVRELSQGLPGAPMMVIGNEREEATHSILRACVADVVECERALRRADALGVVTSSRTCLALLAQESTLCSGAVDAVKTLDDLDDPAHPVPGRVPLPEKCLDELAFCVSWLTYVWGRAALAGIQPQVSQQQAEQWAFRMDKPASVRDFADIEQAFHELELLGIDELLWTER